VKAFSWLVVAMLVIGCGAKPSETAPGPLTTARRSEKKPDIPVDPKDPDAALYEICRKGHVQMNGAADTIQETLETAKKVKPFAIGDAATAFGEAYDLIDSAGAGIADYTTPLPDAEHFKAVAKEMDERRLKAIEAGNDAIRDLKEAAGILDSVSEKAKDPFKKGANEVAELTDLCVKDLYDAIEALGGQVEE
jgi:hypothetical protein